MELERKALRDLMMKARGLRSPNTASANESHRQAVSHNMLLITGPYGRIVGMVGVDDLFDEDGNRFVDNRL